ncbi:MAG: OmpH family outer membrane protein [Planctomycetes bacterium]|nr:OmpH family outer membrane protein [Planctomycetota bacterium]
MKSIKQILNVPILALVLLAIFLGYKVSATHNTAMPPTVVAVVKINALFSGLKQRADDKIQIKDRATKNTKEFDKRKAELIALEAELKDLVDPIKHRKLSDEIGLKRLELKSWFASASAQAELENAALLQELYKKISDAIKDIADANDYNLVLLDDSNPYVRYNKESRMAPELQIWNKIRSQKILYVDPVIDITNQLITRMNNEFMAANAN